MLHAILAATWHLQIPGAVTWCATTPGEVEAVVSGCRSTLVSVHGGCVEPVVGACLDRVFLPPVGSSQPLSDVGKPVRLEVVVRESFSQIEDVVDV